MICDTIGNQQKYGIMSTIMEKICVYGVFDFFWFFIPIYHLFWNPYYPRSDWKSCWNSFILIWPVQLSVVLD